MTEREIMKELNRKCNPKLPMEKWMPKYCGDMIGSGVFRDVYEFKLNPKKWVVKVEWGGMFCNVSEWRVWANVQHFCGSLKYIKDMFAKNLTIGSTGLFIIQERVTFKEKEFYPKKMPKIFTDFKCGNFGWVGRRFVCIDYANVIDMSISLATVGLKTRAVKWRKDYSKVTDLAHARAILKDRIKEGKNG